MFICNQPEECAYCRATIASGERWVREKIYEPALVGQSAIAAIMRNSSQAKNLKLSKTQIEQDIARTTARAA